MTLIFIMGNDLTIRGNSRGTLVTKGYRRAQGGAGYAIDTVAPFVKAGNKEIVTTGFWSKARMVLFDPCKSTWNTFVKAAGKLTPSAWGMIGVGAIAAVLAGKLVSDTMQHADDADPLHDTSLESIRTPGIHFVQLGLAGGALFSALKLSRNFKAGALGMGACMAGFLVTSFMKWREDRGNPVNTDSSHFLLAHVTHQFRNPGTTFVS